MKQSAKQVLLTLVLIAGTTYLHAASCGDCSAFSMESCDVSCSEISSSVGCGPCSSVYIPRSTVSNTAYFWFPWRTDIDCVMNGILEVGFEYQRSFDGQKIAQSLFGSERLHFQGSNITGVARDPLALIADNFGMSQQCDATIAFKPRIQNYNLNFHGRVGFDRWVEGLYADVYFAFTHQNRYLDLRTTNTICQVSPACNPSCAPTCVPSPVSTLNVPGACSVNFMSNNCGITTGTGCTTPFPAGYMAAASVATVPTLVQALQGQTLFGDMQTPWSFGRFPTFSQSENGVSGLAVVAGWNFWQSDCGHFGTFFQYVAPTGNKPNPQFLFSPVVGNGKHHELGGGISAHYELWNNGCDQAINIYLDGFAMTALRNCQLRSFDFCGKGCLSRYMLLEAINPATGAYTGSLIDGINFATRYARVKVSVKGDASLRFVYSYDGLNIGFGYNAYGQSRESVCITNGIVNGCDGTPVLDPTVNYGFKGCASLYTSGMANSPALTQSSATITTCGTNDATPVTLQVPSTCSVSDCSSACSAVSNCSNTCSTASASLCTGSLDPHSGEAPRQFTNKGFLTIDYTWNECDYLPYLGIGGEAEGGSQCSLNQWGVWVKGGIQF